MPARKTASEKRTTMTKKVRKTSSPNTPKKNISTTSKRSLQAKKQRPQAKEATLKARSTGRAQSVKKKDSQTESLSKSASPLTRVRGMRDILPENYILWTHLYRALDRAVKEFGFRRIELPMVEYADLYKRTIGDGTDIIDKELYEFTTRGGDRVALRPELTAGLVRAFIENGMHVQSKPIKLFSCGSLFRYDRPQAGRYREHKQANFDVFGESDPVLDAQLIQMANRVLSGVGLKKVRFLVNTLGSDSDRVEYRKLLVAYLRSKRAALCTDCAERLKKNPLRILDCKADGCREVIASSPHMIDHLSAESHDHFKYLLEYLDELEVPYAIDPFLVRGLDYYNDTVFEVVCESDCEGKAPFSLGGGGRYDGLVGNMGGGQIAAIGFGLGLDRIVLEMQKQNTKIYCEPKPRVFLVQLGEMAKKKSLKLFEYLEKNGILMAESFGRGSLKAQLRSASKAGSEITIILGQKEVMDQTVIVKNMKTGSQETVPQDKLVEFVKKALRENGK